MSTEDKRTRAELLAELDAERENVRRAKSDAYDAHQALPNTPARIPEADALAACIRALDALTERKGSSTGYGYGGNYSLVYQGDYSTRSQTEVERVLRLLAAKYGVPLIEVRTEPCKKFHVEDPSEERLLAALRMSSHLV